MTDKTPNPMPTTERLAVALEALDDNRLVGMIHRARHGYYDDYKSTLVQPLVTLVKELHSFGLPGMVQRVIDGEFDSTKKEAEAWANSPEGQRIFAELSEAARFRPQSRQN
jgi:hypothetical protein